MNKFVLLYDCPFKKCDKIWVYNGLKKYRMVKVIDIIPKTTYLKLALFLPKIKIGKVMLRFVVFFQSFRAIISSNKNDIIIVWNYMGGILMNQLLSFFKVKRKVVSFCWIDLPRKKNYKKVKKCLLNNNFIPIINDKRLEKKLVDLFDLETWNGLFLPDVYDDKEKFLDPIYIEDKNNRYCFAGGLNNRDWDVLIDCAKKLKEIKFVIVSNRGAIERDDIPENVQLYEDLEKKEYYKMMKESFITICPLKEDRVSGLINIIKSIQYGIPCITTKLEVTSQYYPLKAKSNLLYQQNDIIDLINKIKKTWDITQKDYEKIVNKLQKHIKNEFDPNNNVKKLYSKLKKKKWL